MATLTTRPPAPGAGRPAPRPLAEVAQELLRLTRAQAETLAAEDVAAFASLTDARDGLVAELARWPAASATAETRAVLHAVGALDQQNVAQARRLLADTARALKDLRHGQAALHGYGRPGAVVAPAAGFEREC
jgi:hypothetical protein